MAAGGVDPDEDVRLVVLPPPYMVDSLANKQVDGFCVGAPWNSVAVDLGVGFILHFVSEILQRATEKLLAVRSRWAQEHARTLTRLVRAHRRAAAFVEDTANRDEVAAILAAPNRIGVAQRGDPAHPRRPHQDRARRHGARERALSAGRPQGRGAARSPCRPHGSMPRWCVGDRRRCRPRCWPRPKRSSVPTSSMPRSTTASRTLRASRPTGSARSPGPPFDPDDIAAHLAAWQNKHPPT